MKVISSKIFTSGVIREGSWGHHELGDHQSTMTVYGNDAGEPVMIEWDIPSLEETEHIGIELDGRSVTGYDGVMCIPDQAIELLEELGYNCDDIK